MRPLIAFAWAILLCTSCSKKDGIDPAKTGGREKPKAEAGQSEPAKKDLDYWVAQAKTGPKDVEATVKALVEALKDPSPETKVAAGDALGKLGEKSASAAPVLVDLLEDPSAWARVSAMETLVAIGPKSVPALVDAVKNGKTPPLRIRSVLVLGSMAADAKEAVSTLEKVAKDESLAWRGLASGALAKIDPEKYGGGVAAGAVDKAVALPEVDKSKLKASTDWAEFQGPNRDSYCTETGLLKSWPETGPKLLWQTKGLGHGYSSIVIAGDKIFTAGDFGEHGKGGRQCVVALSLTDGTERWVAPIGPAGDDAAYGAPTVDGNLLYVVGSEGDLVCMETTAGQIKWKKHFNKDFGGKIMSKWQFSEAPLVDGAKLVCSPGGKNAAIVALNKMTGELIWKAAEPAIGEGGKTGAGYASMVVAEIHGVRQYIQMTGRGVVSVEAETGKFLWGYNRIANGIANIPTPRVRGNFVFVTTGYGTGCALLKIEKAGDTFSAEEVYFLGPKDLENHHGGVVLVGDHVYGGSGTNKGAPVCLELATGKIAWKEKAPQRGSASVLYADGHVIFRYDRGMVVLAEATPEAFRVKGKFTPPLGKGPAWSYPVIHQKKLYLRHSDILMCYDVGEK